MRASGHTPTEGCLRRARILTHCLCFVMICPAPCALPFSQLKQTHFNHRTNPIWGETAQNRNAVKREMKLSAVPLSAAAAANHHHNTGGPHYSVITNSDPLSAFDNKFLGMLFGLNNDYTEAWKKRAEKEKEKRHRKEMAIGNGQSVSSDEEEPEPTTTSSSGGSHHGHHGHSHSTANDKISGAAPSTPNFVPQHHSSSGGPSSSSSYLPMTPQKSHSSSSAYASAANSPAHDYHAQQQQQQHSASKNAAKSNNAHMHRSRYSHDYS